MIKKLKQFISDRITHYQLVKKYAEFLEGGLYSERHSRYGKRYFGFPVVRKSRIESCNRELLSELLIDTPNSVQVILGGWSRKVVCVYNNFVVSYYDACRLGLIQ